MDNSIFITHNMGMHITGLVKGGVPLASEVVSCPYTLYSWLDSLPQAPTLKDGGYDLKNNIKKHIKPNIEDRLLNTIPL